MTVDAYLQFWGKAGHGLAAGPQWHPIAYHSLDVAAVAMVLCPSDMAVDPAAVAALVALHDVGKFTRPFQGKVPALWPAALAPFRPTAAVPRHDTAGYAMLRSVLDQFLDPILSDWRHSARDHLYRAVTGHHGRPPEERDRVGPEIACETCFSAACSYIAAALSAISPPTLPRPARGGAVDLAWRLAGLTVVADWIGSAVDWFPYHAPKTSMVEYWHEIALPQARHAVRAAGVLPARPCLSFSLEAMIPGDAADPSPVQELATTIPLSYDGPVMVLVEDQTGSGKTEAALLIAHRLLAEGRADGLFIALPTMATANAMYARLRNAYRMLFDIGTEPSLALAHSRRALNDDFKRSILDRAAQSQSATDDPAEDTASAQCAAWIADDRRRSFFADVGVGTIDQALLGVLPTRHAPLRLHGLRRRVLVIDEAHAYDAYMREELYRLVEFQAALGGNIIILSATLPRQTREHLIAAFRRGTGGSVAAVRSAEYPLVTTVSVGDIAEIPCQARAQLARRVHVDRIDKVDDAVAAIAAATGSGMSVAWVRNAVDDAIEATIRLAEAGIEADLFHARFAMGDRLDRESAVLSRFGKKSTAARRRGRVLVATQVIEQSLDIDFDLMVSDLAPIDLLIQRAGRLWRHQRPDRPCTEPRLVVLSPDPVETPDADWLGPALRRTGFVYPHHGLLWLTARTLFAAGGIVTPADVRRLVEAVYAVDPEIPAGLERSASRATGMVQAHRSLAWQNLLEWGKGYSRDAGPWDSDVRTPTRLGEEQTLLRLARWEDKRLSAWCEADSATRSWALSEVAVARRRVSGVPAPTGALAATVAAVRASWRAWDNEIPILPLTRDDIGWAGEILDARGEVAKVHYDLAVGLRFALK